MANSFLQSNPRAFELILNHIEDLVSVVDLRSRFLYVSPSHQAVLGYSAEDLLGKNGLRLFHPDDQPGIRKKMLQCIVRRKTVSSTARFRSKQGDWVMLEGIGTPILNSLGLPEMILITSRDVSKRHALEEQIRHLALHDPLTGLPNRTLVEDRLRQTLRSARRYRHRAAVIFLDVDNFKEINDNFGHANGDTVLKAVADRLKSSLREEDTVARIGGDEFILVIPSAREEEDLQKIIHKIRRSLRKPIPIEKDQCSITTSMGIALYPSHGTTITTLFKKADSALYSAKGAGKDTVEIYSRGD